MKSSNFSAQEKYQRFPVAVVYMLTAVFSLAVSSFAAKLAMGYVSIYLTIFMRFLIPLLCVFSVLVWNSDFDTISIKDIKLQSVRASALFLAKYLLFLAIAKLPLSEAILLFCTYPLFIMIFDLITGKLRDKYCVLGVIVSFLGILLILHVQKDIWNAIYVGCGLLSAFFVSISQIVLHESTKASSNLATMFVVNLLCTTFAFIALVVHTKLAGDAGYANVPVEVLFLLLIVGFCCLCNQVFRFKAFSLVKAASVLTPLMYLSVVFAAIIDYFYYHYLSDLQTISGGLLVVCGIFVIMKHHKIVDRSS
ncbi:MAG: hypothetical protein COB50_00400 [Thiotrichales bacterium]|nr:MAG: hypothetical protein COB50_00400 [Thiotrichales bacterium]